MSEENTSESGTLSIKKESLWKYSTFILVAVLIVGAFIFFNNSDSTGTGNVVNNGERVNIEVGDAPYIGSDNAPVTIVEYSDFSCPYCAAASGANEELSNYMKSKTPSWEPAVSNIIKDYTTSGKVKLVFKYFPGHGSGEEAMKVAWCLNEQNLFWKFHDKAFAVYDQTNNLEKMKTIAKDIGADMGKLEQCLSSGKYDSKLESDTKEGQAVGVQGTPAFFVNGKLISGAQPYSVFKEAIDAELS